MEEKKHSHFLNLKIGSVQSMLKVSYVGMISNTDQFFTCMNNLNDLFEGQFD